MFKNLNQKTLKKYVRETIDTIGLCPSIKKLHPDKWELFIYLFERHSDYPNKFCGLIDIKIRNNPVFNNLEVIIVKNNGDEDDVSLFNNCITGKPKDNLTIAMRNSIVPQILEFKNNSSLICVLCGSIEKIHIDHHEPQFIDLKKDFVNEWKGPIPNIFDQNNSHSKIFTSINNEFEKKWIEYHKKNATLRVLCNKCNCSREKSQRFKRTKV